MNRSLRPWITLTLAGLALLALLAPAVISRAQGISAGSTWPLRCDGTQCYFLQDVAGIIWNSTGASGGTQRAAINGNSGGVLGLVAQNSIAFDILSGDKWYMTGNLAPSAANVTAGGGSLGGGPGTGIQAILIESQLFNNRLGSVFRSAVSGILTNVAAYTAVANTTTKTYFGVGAEGLLKTGGTATVGSPAPYGFLNDPGRRVECTFRGIYSTTLTPTMTIDVDLCTVSGCGSGTVVTLGTTGAVTMPASVTNQGWTVDLDFTVFTRGGAGTVEAQGWAKWGSAIGTSVQDEIVNTASSTVNTTVDQYISPAVTWSAASASNTSQLRLFGCRIY